MTEEDYEESIRSDTEKTGCYGQNAYSSPVLPKREQQQRTSEVLLYQVPLAVEDYQPQGVLRFTSIKIYKTALLNT